MKVTGRIIQKHNTAAYWQENDIIPAKGEIIVYDADDTFSTQRLKIGDGITTVTNLPFLSGNSNYSDLENMPIKVTQQTLINDKTGMQGSITPSGSGEAKTYYLIDPTYLDAASFYGATVNDDYILSNSGDYTITDMSSMVGFTWGTGNIKIIAYPYIGTIMSITNAHIFSIDTPINVNTKHIIDLPSAGIWVDDTILKIAFKADVEINPEYEPYLVPVVDSSKVGSSFVVQSTGQFGLGPQIPMTGTTLWREVQRNVQLGRGPSLYPIGTIFNVKHKTFGYLPFMVVAHNVDGVNTYAAISSTGNYQNLEVDNSRFSLNFPSPGIYTFTCEVNDENNLEWRYGDVMINLANYGITYDEGTPQEGDTITIEVRRSEDSYSMTLNSLDLIYYNSLFPTTGSYNPMMTFDAQEKLAIFNEGLPAGNYYFYEIDGETINSNTYAFTLTRDIPEGGSLFYISKMVGGQLIISYDENNNEIETVTCNVQLGSPASKLVNYEHTSNIPFASITASTFLSQLPNIGTYVFTYDDYDEPRKSASLSAVTLANGSTDDVTFDPSVFVSKIEGNTIVAFIYHDDGESSHWSCSTSVDNVTLSEYGITINSSVELQDGDFIHIVEQELYGEWSYNGSVVNLDTYGISVMIAPGAGDASITVTVSEFDNINITTINGVELNNLQHVIQGSNNYRESNIRQWLIGTGKDWYTPSNPFDMPPEYVNEEGFLGGLDTDLVRILKNTHQVIESGSIIDKVFLPSYTQVFGQPAEYQLPENSGWSAYDQSLARKKYKFNFISENSLWWTRSSVADSNSVYVTAGAGDSGPGNAIMLSTFAAPAFVI